MLVPAELPARRDLPPAAWIISDVRLAYPRNDSNTTLAKLAANNNNIDDGDSSKIGPAARFMHCGEVVNEVLYVFGGRDRGRIFTDLFMFHLNARQWSQITLGYEEEPGYVGAAMVKISNDDGPQLLLIGGSGDNKDGTDVRSLATSRISFSVRSYNLNTATMTSFVVPTGHGMDIDLSMHFARVNPNTGDEVIIHGGVMFNNEIETDDPRMGLEAVSSLTMSIAVSSPGSYPLSRLRIFGVQPQNRCV